MAIGKREWGPNVVMSFEELGTITDRSKCDICGARGLAETVVLLVHNADEEIMGNMYVCDPCAAEVTHRVEAQQRGGVGSSPYDDPRLRRRGDRRRRI